MNERFIFEDGLIYDLESAVPFVNMGRTQTFELLTEFYEENQILKQYIRHLYKQMKRLEREVINHEK